MRGAELETTATVNGAAALEARELACGHRPGDPVLSGLTFTVPPGGTTVLVGQSGCGKTTLLKTLLGVLPALGGSFSALGVDSPGRPRAGAVGYIPQGLGLVRHATVLRNVLMGLLHQTGPTQSLLAAFGRGQVERARDALQRVGLEHKAQQRPIHLSGGERRRVAIARALAQRPALLLADEILSELDEGTREAILNEVRALQRETGMGILMVEHDVATSCAVADVVCCLGRGTIAAALSPGPQRRRMVQEALRASA